MAKPQGSKNKNSIKHLNTDQNLSGHSLDSGTYKISIFECIQAFIDTSENRNSINIINKVIKVVI